MKTKHTGDKSKKIYLTIDFDWAPDYAIEMTATQLAKCNTKATYFITHKTDIIHELRDLGHTLGIHPNFQNIENNEFAILQEVERLLKIVPDATDIRMHGLIQSTKILDLIFEKFSQIRNDYSIFLENSHEVHKTSWKLKNRDVSRITYNWEDDIAMRRKFPWDISQVHGALNILDFHPIHIYLNSSDMNNYQQLKSELDQTPLQSAPKLLVNKYVNHYHGARTFFNNITEYGYPALNFGDIK